LKKNRSRSEFDAKIMPSRPSEEREDHVNTCPGLQKRLETDPEFLSKIITGDETWVYGYDPETKRQPSQGKSP